MKKLIFATLVFFILVVTSIAWAGTTVSLIWTPNSEVDLAGYRMYQDGVQVVEIACPADDATCCEWTSTELTEGTHSWYATAFDNDKNESEPSNTVSYNVDLTAPSAPQISITINLNVTITP